MQTEPAGEIVVLQGDLQARRHRRREKAPIYNQTFDFSEMPFGHREFSLQLLALIEI
jgi:hypothetical protein